MRASADDGLPFISMPFVVLDADARPLITPVTKSSATKLRSELPFTCADEGRFVGPPLDVTPKDIGSGRLRLFKADFGRSRSLIL